MTVKESTAKKIGLFTSLSMLIGSVVGIGIFLKNNNIFAINGYNAVGILITWILGSVIAFATAYCFVEIGSTVRSHSGIAGWAQRLLGTKFGNFLKVVFPLFYLSIMEVILSAFLGESIFMIFNSSSDLSEIHFGYILLVGFVLMNGFIIFNYFSLKASGIMSSITTALKFIPLIAIIIAGVCYAATQHTAGLFDKSFVLDGKTRLEKPSFQLIIASLPSVLFAFDSFTNIGNLALDIKKPERNVSLTIIIGMLLCSAFYILVTISQILVAQGNGLSFFKKPFFGNESVQKGISITISVFICISIIGVLNSFSASIIKSYKSLIDEKVIFNHRWLVSVSNKFKREDKEGLRPGLILLLIVSFIWSLIIYIPSMCIGNKGTDAFLDGISNFPTLFFFLIYGILVAGALVNRFTKRIEVNKSKLFLVFAPISMIGIAIVFAYLFFYQYLVLPFLTSPSDPDYPFKWGLFFDNEFKVQGWMASLCFFLAIAVFISMPFINFGIIKLMEKHNNKKDNK